MIIPPKIDFYSTYVRGPKETLEDVASFGTQIKKSRYRLRAIILASLFLFYAANAFSFDPENKEMAPQAKKFADDADTFQKNNNFEKSAESLLKALSYEPQNSTLHTKLGIVYHAQFEMWMSNNQSADDREKSAMIKKTLLKAIKELEKAVALDPTDSVARFFLGMEYKRTYEVMKSDKAWLDKAVVEFEKSLKFDPENMIAYHMLGVVNYVDLNRPEKAKEYFIKATEIAPKFVEAHLYLANIYCDTNELSLAREELEKVKLFDPQDIEVSKDEKDALENRINKK